jgi:hypothetical protein
MSSSNPSQLNASDTTFNALLNTNSLQLNAINTFTETYINAIGNCTLDINMCKRGRIVSTVEPLVLYTDIASGPNSGGENNKGIYLSIFGKNFGAAGLGTVIKVYINDVEVDNYRYVGLSRARQDIEQITVQIGSLGSPAQLTPLPIKVVVNGLASNTDQTFAVVPGTIYFVATNGINTNDTTSGGTFDKPFLSLQKAGIGTTFSIQPASVSGAYGRVRAGDFIVMRGGTYTDLGFGGYVMQALNKSGCPIGINCAQGGGTSSGPISIMGYPGETVLIDRTYTAGDSSGGVFSSADSTRQLASYGARWSISNIVIESGFNDGPIETQKGDTNPLGSHWRVVNNEMTAKSCARQPLCRAGGVAGNGDGNFWVGNYIHDIFDKADGTTDLENHGMYIGGKGSYEIAFNRFENIYGGNGIQTNNNGGNGINNVHIHHNLINTVGKHGINIVDHEAGLQVFNNVVMNTSLSGIRFNSDLLSGAKIFNNTFYLSDTLNAFSNVRPMLSNDGNITANAMDIRNNIFVPGNSSRVFEGGNIGFGAVASKVSNNLYFNGADSVSGANHISADPLFLSITPGVENLRLKAGSPAIDKGSSTVSGLVKDDFDTATSTLVRTLRPLAIAFDIGAFER